MREKLGYDGHPVRDHGPATMAWARLDGEPWGAEILIEEIQSDWFRVADEIAREKGLDAATRRALGRYAKTALAPYRAEWERVTMLAAIEVAVREFGVRRVWMHQPVPGAMLNGIPLEDAPLVSLYRALPRRFGFAPTREAPGFLARERGPRLRRLAEGAGPLFWRLDLDAHATGPPAGAGGRGACRPRRAPRWHRAPNSPKGCAALSQPRRDP